MNRGFANIAIIIALVVIVGGAGWWYMNKSRAPATSDPTQLPTTEQPAIPPMTDGTANWKTFVNSRDGYSVRYPNEEIAGTPSIDCCSDLKNFGFNQSMSFMRYGGWADIYIFSGSIDQAITAYKKVDSENRVYGSIGSMVIGGKNGRVVSWSNKLDPSSRVSSGYFVEYKPSKTLCIDGSQEFVTTIAFLTTKEPVQTSPKTEQKPADTKNDSLTFVAAPSSGKIFENIGFYLSGSASDFGKELSYSIDFGDGTTETRWFGICEVADPQNSGCLSTNHQYASPGSYIVKVMYNDNILRTTTVIIK